MSDYQEPYRRPMNAPTGLTNRMREYMRGRDSFTADDAAVDLRVDRKAVIDAVKNLMKTSELELAETPAKAASPRVYRAKRLAPETVKKIETILHTDSPGPDPERMKAPIEELAAAEPETAYVTPPTQHDIDDAIADLMAMRTGRTGEQDVDVDPVRTALVRVLLAAEGALLTYNEQARDPIRDRLVSQIEEAHKAIDAWDAWDETRRANS